MSVAVALTTGLAGGYALSAVTDRSNGGLAASHGSGNTTPLDLEIDPTSASFSASSEQGRFEALLPLEVRNDGSEPVVLRSFELNGSALQGDVDGTRLEPGDTLPLTLASSTLSCPEATRFESPAFFATRADVEGPTEQVLTKVPGFVIVSLREALQAHCDSAP